MKEKKNAFSQIFDVVEESQPDSFSTSTESPSEKAELSKTQSTMSPQVEKEELSPAPAKRGRPKGKKSDPDFVSTIVYIRQKTHIQVKRLLLDLEEQGKKQDCSELVQELLDAWVVLRQGGNPQQFISKFSDNQKS